MGKLKFYLLTGLLFGVGAVTLWGLVINLFAPEYDLFHPIAAILPLTETAKILFLFAILWFGTLFGMIWTWMLIRHHYSLPLTQLSVLVRQLRLGERGRRSRHHNAPMEFHQFSLNNARNNKEISDLAQELEKLQKRLEVRFSEQAENSKRIETAYNAQAQFLLSSGQNLWQQINHIAKLTESLSQGAESHSAAQSRAYCSEIKNLTQNLAQLAATMSDMSRIHGYNSVVREEALDIGQLANEQAEDFAQSLRGSGVSLGVSVAETLPWLRADATQIRRIFSILLENARKFTLPGGTIKLTVQENSVRKIEILVEDDGIGMPDSDIYRLLFPENIMIGDAASSPPQSQVTLSLVKHMVESHGGSIKIDSHLGRGTKIHIAFPPVRTVRAVYNPSVVSSLPNAVKRDSPKQTAKLPQEQPLGDGLDGGLGRSPA